jgi:hypothetical protein
MYVPWPPVEVRLSILKFCFLFTRAKELFVFSLHVSCGPLISRKKLLSIKHEFSLVFNVDNG